MGRMEWSGGGKWDNCNSIINKYILKKKDKKKKKKERNKTSQPRALSPLLFSTSVPRPRPPPQEETMEASFKCTTHNTTHWLWTHNTKQKCKDKE